jgi:hypothetical protein
MDSAFTGELPLGTKTALRGPLVLKLEQCARVLRKSRNVSPITLTIRKIFTFGKYGSRLVGLAPMNRTNRGGALRKVTSAVGHDDGARPFLPISATLFHVRSKENC